MTAHLRIAALDTALELMVAPQAPATFVSAVERAWSRCLVAPPEASSPVRTLPVATPEQNDEESIRAALQRLSQDVTLSLITAQTGHLIMLHAGAVSDPDTGSGLVFVAASGTGKTTLARLLGRTYSYLTDETVGIDPTTGRIHPYPKPLSVAHDDRHRKVETSPDDLELRHSPADVTVKRVVLLDRETGPRRPVRAEELGTIDAIEALLPQTSALNRLPRPLHALTDLFDRAGPVIRLTYHEASDLVPLAPQLLEQTA